MISNSLNLTNIKDAIYKNPCQINENGELDNITDLLLISNGNVNGNSNFALPLVMQESYRNSLKINEMEKKKKMKLNKLLF